MSIPPGGPMEVVFSFDTTGSMSQVLDEVKARVSDIVQRLQADIPGFKVGIIAHGDYCDANMFYVSRVLPLTDNLADVVTFINDTEGTGGGDVPECYELALRHAKDMPWTPGSKRVLVVIGDAYPHEPDYELNTSRLDWKQEVNDLVNKAVTIYGVQVGDDNTSTDFFLTLAAASRGQYLNLTNLQSICQVIMGICYREQGAEMFHNFESDLRGGVNVSNNIENVLGTLRPDISMTSIRKSRDNNEINNNYNDSPPTPCSSGADISNDSTTSLVTDPAELVQAASIKTGVKRKRDTSDTRKHVDESPLKRVKTMKTSTKKTILVKEKKNRVIHKMNKSTERGKKTHALGDKKATKRSITLQSGPVVRQRREHIASKHFPFANLSWCQWHAASVPSKHYCTGGVWKTIGQSRTRNLWRRDLLLVCYKALQKEVSDCRLTVFELGIMASNQSTIKAVAFKSTKIKQMRPGGVFGRPWYTELFKPFRSRIYYTSKEARLFIRWAHVNDVGLAKEIPRKIDYAFNSDRDL